MDKLIINGGHPLKGELKVSGAKNVAMKVILAGLLTDSSIHIQNVPHISSVHGTLDILNHLGATTHFSKNEVVIDGKHVNSFTVPLECGGLYRTAPMAIGPLLARFGKARVPNPGGCRLGKRPIDRHIDGLSAMGAKISYSDGYFDAEAKKLHGVRFRFSQNTHTGTETLILAAVLAEGETILENASAEVEVDDLILLLNQMGAKIKRIKEREIVIKGVKQLHGTEFCVMPDRNEVVTFAIAAIVSGGTIVVHDVHFDDLQVFFDSLNASGIKWDALDKNTARFYGNQKIKPTHIVTTPHPGFMTDWQAPWALLMTQATGESTIHETIYEDRFGYASELKKMGSQISFYQPKVDHPETFYNFNWQDKIVGRHQGIKINGPTKLHNAILEVSDLRAGATLVLGALCADGESVIHGIEHVDRGYENLEGRLKTVGAHIMRIKE